MQLVRSLVINHYVHNDSFDGIENSCIYGVLEQLADTFCTDVKEVCYALLGYKGTAKATPSDRAMNLQVSKNKSVTIEVNRILSTYYSGCTNKVMFGNKLLDLAVFLASEETACLTIDQIFEVVKQNNLDIKIEVRKGCTPFLYNRVLYVPNALVRQEEDVNKEAIQEIIKKHVFDRSSYLMQDNVVKLIDIDEKMFMQMLNNHSLHERLAQRGLRMPDIERSVRELGVGIAIVEEDGILVAQILTPNAEDWQIIPCDSIAAALQTIHNDPKQQELNLSEATRVLKKNLGTKARKG